jgi:predicted amidohydrolase YtcJ
MFEFQRDQLPILGGFRSMVKRIFYNGMITTLDPTCPQAEALYVERGRIIALGTNEEIFLQFGREEVEKIDLGGGYGYPGLVDSHLHLALVGKKQRQLDLTGCRSKRELLQQVRQWAEQIAVERWIIGNGWDENRLVDEMPTLDELEEASLGRPVLLWRFCQHVCLVNRTAYRLAGIEEGSEPQQGGIYGRDHQGRLNGWIYENAFRSFQQVIPKPTSAEKKEEVRAGMEQALLLGLTGVHTDDLREIGSLEQLLAIYEQLHQEGLYLRTHHLLYHPYLSEWDELGGHHLRQDEWFGIGAVKIFADGSLGGRTALLSQPYHDDPQNYGVATHSWEELSYLVSQAVDRQLPVAIHSIGDQATEKVLAIMHHYQQGAADVPLRHRLIHAQILRTALVEQMSAMPIAVDIQPRFVASDFPWVIERIGEERLDYAYAWRTLLNAGIHCAGGSDSPIEPLSPLLGIHAAVTRCHPDHASAQSGYQPQQKLDRLQALALFTTGCAYAANEEHQRGTLAVGKQADLSVFDRDLLGVPEADLIHANTLYTIVNGEIAYQK